VVQIWPGLFVCKQVTVCPGHIWTTLYFGSRISVSTLIIPEFAIGSILWDGSVQLESIESSVRCILMLSSTAVLRLLSLPLLPKWNFSRGSPPKKRCVDWDIRLSGMLCGVDWWLVTDVSGQPICPIVKGQAVYSATNYQSMLHDIPEKPRYPLHRGGSLISSCTHSSSPHSSHMSSPP
jgi:hypothetical protein